MRITTFTHACVRISDAGRVLVIDPCAPPAGPSPLGGGLGVRRDSAPAVEP